MDKYLRILFFFFFYTNSILCTNKNIFISNFIEIVRIFLWFFFLQINTVILEKKVLLLVFKIETVTIYDFDKLLFRTFIHFYTHIKHVPMNIYITIDTLYIYILYIHKYIEQFNLRKILKLQ